MSLELDVYARISTQVLATSENITKRLATEKACSWLSANITGN